MYCQCQSGKELSKWECSVKDKEIVVTRLFVTHSPYIFNFKGETYQKDILFLLAQALCVLYE